MTKTIYELQNLTIFAYVEVSKSGKRSKRVQINCDDEDYDNSGYADLNQKEVKKLIESLNAWLKEDGF